MRQRRICRSRRLLRLSLIQVSVGMSLVLLIGTLNRVMIVELGVPASLVGVMISLPLIFAPFRALIGFRSDTHQSVLGWRRVPFIYRGTMVQFGGLAIMPFALLVLSGGGNSASAPVWLGQLAAGLAFLLVGVGLHTTQTVGLALATDLASTESQPKVVGLMYSMLLFGTIASALLFGALLANFTPGRLIQVIQGSAVATIVLNGVALWKQETRNRSPLTPVNQRQPSFQESWESFIHGGRAMRRLVAVGLGTMAFSMEDVLLEPYGGQILHLTVGDTTKLTATLAAGGLLGFGLASRVLSRGADPFRMASYGALVGIPAFVAVIASAPLSVPAVVWSRDPVDWFRLRTVRPWHLDRDDEPGAAQPDRVGARRLGRRSGLRGRLGDCAWRHHPRRGWANRPTIAGRIGGGVRSGLCYRDRPALRDARDDGSPAARPNDGAAAAEQPTVGRPTSRSFTPKGTIHDPDDQSHVRQP